MSTNSDEKFKGKYRTTSHRLRGYDYAQEGAYFITICCANRECLFGEIVDGKILLNDFGNIADFEWKNTENIRPNIVIDEYVVMPDHIHGIVVIDYRIGDEGRDTVQNDRRDTVHRVSTGEKIWQPGFYDHIIRNEDELNRIRQYIIDNPKNWNADKNRPENIYF